MRLIPIGVGRALHGRDVGSVGSQGVGHLGGAILRDVSEILDGANDPVAEALRQTFTYADRAAERRGGFDTLDQCHLKRFRTLAH